MTDHHPGHEALLRRQRREGMAALSPRERHALATCPACSAHVEQLQQSIGELMDFADMHRTGAVRPVDDVQPEMLPVREAAPPDWMRQPEAKRPRDWSVLIAIALVAVVLAAAAIVI